jgi:hypothetical protein
MEPLTLYIVEVAPVRRYGHPMATYFADHFEIDPDILGRFGAFNISLVTDLPLFIDPFLLFHSKNREYQDLHDRIIRYLVFLRDKSLAGSVSVPLLRSWYCFPEVKQNWLGFSKQGNGGSGLGIDFAATLHANLNAVFPEFGSERVTKGSHLEKVCLIRDGVGRDNISDFTTNLIKQWLCEYTERFALIHLREHERRRVSVKNVTFNYETEVWQPQTYTLPWIDGDYVILTPKDMLTRDENWINRGDLIRNFDEIPVAIPDAQLRAQVSNYFERVLVRTRKREPSQKERAEAAIQTILAYPQLIDYYIRYKEDDGDAAQNISSEKVLISERIFIFQLKDLQATLRETPFYDTLGTTYEEAHARLAYLKDVIENKGGYRLFYIGEKPIEREQDLQVMYRLVWIGTPQM